VSGGCKCNPFAVWGKRVCFWMYSTWYNVCYGVSIKFYVILLHTGLRPLDHWHRKTWTITFIAELFSGHRTKIRIRQFKKWLVIRRSYIYLGLRCELSDGSDLAEIIYVRTADLWLYYYIQYIVIWVDDLIFCLNLF